MFFSTPSNSAWNWRWALVKAKLSKYGGAIFVLKTEYFREWNCPNVLRFVSAEFLSTIGLPCLVNLRETRCLGANLWELTGLQPCKFAEDCFLFTQDIDVMLGLKDVAQNGVFFVCVHYATILKSHICQSVSLDPILGLHSSSAQGRKCGPACRSFFAEQKFFSCSL